ncbi:Histone-lysine N-methyltransferase SETMAR [Folsomia candida]|uniref:Histone-lysine N-methyltransferase SETMAR n=1 Tax=Folsomia candida TaxID=158441 RepID=A0A226DK94_FOLCA|nr:Histone-lysine N-methyltransferase SETMAR [Folsomia candida]
MAIIYGVAVFHVIVCCAVLGANAYYYSEYKKLPREAFDDYYNPFGGLWREWRNWNIALSAWRWGVCNCCRLRPVVSDKKSPGRPKSVSSTERLQKLQEPIIRDPRLKLSYLADKMGVLKPAICSTLTEDLDDNAPTNTSLVSRAAADEKRFTVINHPPYSPALTLIDYYPFQTLNKSMKGKRFWDDNGIKS